MFKCICIIVRESSTCAMLKLNMGVHTIHKTLLINVCCAFVGVDKNCTNFTVRTSKYKKLNVRGAGNCSRTLL